ncbi:MAG: glycosyltransferase family 4 protein [Anaerolineae bacterium]
MRIGIDYTAAVRQQGGIGRYTRSLIRALSEIDTRNQYVLFVMGGHEADDGHGNWPDNFRLRPVPISDRWFNVLWQRVRVPVPVQVWTGRLDLFHSPDFVLPPLGRTPAVLTVHDLSFLRVPWCFVPGFRDYLEAAVSRSVRKASLILADSLSTERDLAELLGVELERVHVLYPGVDSRFRPVTDPEALGEVRQRYSLPESFVLGLSTLQPRKNFAGLIDAFGRLLAAEGGAQAIQGLQLVIAGGSGWLSEDIQEAIGRAGLEGRVRVVGFVDDHDLPALYTLASAFAFPSWYEGFGVPVLEAMACGTPVVAADNSSLPEVVGEAGLLVGAGDADALAQALFSLLVRQDVRQRLVARGLERVRRFSWPASATALLQAYERTLGGYPGGGQRTRSQSRSV